MKWLLIDDSPNGNHVCMTIQQIAEELAKTEKTVNIMNSFHKSLSVPKEEMASVIRGMNPDVVLFQGPTGLRYLDILGPFNGQCVNLWFDDPLMRIGAYGLDAQMEESFYFLWNHFVWDGYWREKVKAKWKNEPMPIHLAANPNQFYETSTVFNRDDIIFLGNLHSPRSIEVNIESLPPTYVKIVNYCKNYLNNLSDDCDVPSWDKLIEAAFLDSLPGEKKLICIQSDRSNEVRSNLQWVIWAMSKNFVRIRMLKRALKVGTVRMFADTVQHSHASESETRGLVGEWSSRLSFHATDGLNADQLAELYHHGWIQIQATDPQSVNGGIPYRVFQTAASGRALLTDKKPELADAFEYDREILTYDNMTHFEHRLVELSARKSDLFDIGKSARARMVKDHTWRNRMDYIKHKCGLSQLHSNTPAEPGRVHLEFK
jgi:hypothetical protein